MRFSAFALFTLLWSILIYSPLCHWAWGGGWLMKRGALDFAGGTVVHISSGISALVAALLVGKRLGYGKEPRPPHNLPLTVAGAALLWVGWFGFNGGSALAANGLGADDALDVVGVHGVGRMFGAIATGFLATKTVNSLGNDGLLYGNPGQVVTQLEGVAATLLFCGVGSFILLKIIDAIVGLRVDEEAEVSGLDISEHSERGYALGGE